jgi:type IV pilus assembly protein PilX
MAVHPQLVTRSRQGGAALIIGMILLLVLTVLAISGMNTASLEFVMAGNEQFQKNSFQAADSGIEQALNNSVFQPGAAPILQNAFMLNAPTDQYNFAITSDLNGNGLPLGTPGNSANVFTTYFFTLQSIGQSSRNSRAVHTQGVSFFAPSGGGGNGPVCGGAAAVLGAGNGACP